MTVQHRTPTFHYYYYFRLQYRAQFALKSGRSEEFTAIINTSKACILAVGGIQQVPVVKNGQVVPGNVMKVTLSCDHRVVDGAMGAEFLNTFKQILENPILLNE